MSWLEPEVQRFLILISATCTVLPACLYGMNTDTRWMFATSFADVGKLGGVCPHPPHSHQSIQSSSTPPYPDDLASSFSAIIGPLLSGGPLDIAWAHRFSILPIKSNTDFPFSQEDGGGLHSRPDWSQPDRIESDCFASLRAKWMARIVQHRLDKVLLAHVGSDNPDPPFAAEFLQPFINDLEQFLAQHGHPPNWTIREHQPMHLQILQALHSIMADPDISLFPSLIAGVRTGIAGDIPASNVFPLRSKDQLSELPLSVHLQNWHSAEEDPQLTETLVQEELDRGWVFKCPGTLADAQQEFPHGVSIGKLGIAKSDTRPPRLVVDSSVCGLNSRCVIPEKGTLPTAKEVIRSYPLRNCTSPLAGFSLDIKSARKRIVLHAEERGLVGFSLHQELYFYSVTPFGASFSAAWWSRLGGWMLRCLHHLIWWSHCGFIYVDDFLFFMDANIMPLAATLCTIFCQIMRIPISWRKTEMGSSITWVGWKFNFRAGVLSIPQAKLDKVRDYVAHLRRSSKTNRKHLEKTIGLLMWITQLFPLMRIWLHYLYQDLYTVPATHFSIDPGDWPNLSKHLSDKLVFTSRPASTAIPLGSTLLSVRHTAVQSKQDLNNVHISTAKRIWLRIKDPSSSRRTVREDSYRILRLFDEWLSDLPPLRSMSPRPYWEGIAAADACANNDYCQIGGFITHVSGRCFWFSERFHRTDFSVLPFEIDSDLQKNIASFETLAQVGLIWLVAAFYPGSRMPICLKSLSDNTGAESVSNKCFTTTKPLCFFVEVLTKFASQTGVELDVSHIPGKDNDVADDLSRWDFTGLVPHGFSLADRVRMSVLQLWKPKLKCTLVPSESHLVWNLPT